MVIRRAASGLVTAALGAAVLGAACGNGAVGVQACKSVEEARCRAAPACTISIQPPYQVSGSSIDECIRYYDVACLHGLTVGDPGGAAVSACVAAIEESGNCDLVRLPETGACSWLAPIASAPTSSSGSSSSGSSCSGSSSSGSSSSGSSGSSSSGSSSSGSSSSGSSSSGSSSSGSSSSTSSGS